jgi:hypothetical protein
MVWSIFRTVKFSLSLLFNDCVRLFVQPAPLKRFDAVCVPESREPLEVERTGEDGRGRAHGVAVEREHVLVESNFLWLCGQSGAIDRIGVSHCEAHFFATFAYLAENRQTKWTWPSERQEA